MLEHNRNIVTKQYNINLSHKNNTNIKNMPLQTNFQSIPLSFHSLDLVCNMKTLYLGLIIDKKC